MLQKCWGPACLTGSWFAAAPQSCAVGRETHGWGSPMVGLSSSGRAPDETMRRSRDKMEDEIVCNKFVKAKAMRKESQIKKPIGYQSAAAEQGWTVE